MEHTSLTVPGFPAGAKFACVLRNVFTAAECADLIARSEQVGFIPAKEGDQSWRSNYRCIIDDASIAQILFERVRAWLPTSWKYDDPYEEPPRSEHTDHLVGINERLRFQRYDAGQAFAKHVDGSYVTPDNQQRTHITLQLYLNDGFEGGATIFLDPLHYKEMASAPLHVVPETGMVLLFEHELLHAGQAVQSGRKYTLRTDVLYQVGAI